MTLRERAEWCVRQADDIEREHAGCCYDGFTPIDLVLARWLRGLAQRVLAAHDQMDDLLS